jgi:hypothetical protein
MYLVIIYLRIKLESEDRKLKFDWLDFMNQVPKFFSFMVQSYPKITLQTIRFGLFTNKMKPVKF